MYTYIYIYMYMRPLYHQMLCFPMVFNEINELHDKSLKIWQKFKEDEYQEN